MMVIYFIAWLFNKIKGARSGENENEQPERKRTLAEVQENRRRHLQRQSERDGSAGDASQTLRQLFESINAGDDALEESFLPEPDAVIAQAPAKAQPAEKAATPPPLKPRLTAAEKQALKKLKRSAASPLTKSKRHALSHSLKSMTRGRGLRQAVVLKEILDQPRSLRPF